MAEAIRASRLLSTAYPIIILDEFQDTDAAEWRMIQAVGQMSMLIALADPDQRIYEFRGADPLRIDAFIAKYHPTMFDFGLENNRSNGTDIVSFGNDLITGANVGKTYANVEVTPYQVRRAPSTHVDIKLQTIRCIKRLLDSGLAEWSLGVLVPTNQLMMEVSDYLLASQQFQRGRRLPSVTHSVAFDSDGPSLAAAVVAAALESGDTISEVATRIMLGLREHIRGRKGNKSPGQQQLELADFLGRYVKTGQVRGSARKALIDDCLRCKISPLTSQRIGSALTVECTLAV